MRGAGWSLFDQALQYSTAQSTLVLAGIVRVALLELNVVLSASTST